MWESKMLINDVREIRCKTTVYLGVGAIKKIFDICEDLKSRGIDKVVVITGKGAYEKTGAWKYVTDAFEKNGIKHVLYNKVTPNPTADQVDEATNMARELGAKAVIGIGGGSPIDAAKSVAILLEYPDKNCRDIYEYKFVPSKAAPIVAINLTHGTGTEADRFAVVSIPEKEYKPAIAYDCIYPLYSIDDPSLMTMLPANQTLYVSVDAINHIIEAATTKVATPYSILLAKETFRLITKYLPQALMHPQDLTARYYLLYASLIAGISFDNGLLHFTHALEHPLSAVKPELAHGLGLGMLLPAVIKHIYPACPEVLADILNPIAPDLVGVPGEAEYAAELMETWLRQVGLIEKLQDLGFTENDVEKLANLALSTPSLDLLLSMAPIPATKETIKQIYTDSL
ncbi:iron-containing alcohol dehydrogenase [Caloramator sp. E03]|uniref:iron-containing alcohol dehydrogenase n=1 Tax=Caloramator sp. E03 TaxID=2576307 RepID=UPI0011103B88|nr:iron-containing alcohol dehydrogenase [Caloramator sp. E03]QCX33781.1 iron-containing alcohol dehydrogenase [Caloramator sp. E03]